MVDRARVLEHVAVQYPEQIPNAFTKLYNDQEPALREVFANLHERLNNLFLFLNNKIAINGHFNADPSRSLLDLIEEIRDLRTTLHRVGVEVTIRGDYEHILEDCAAFLVPSGGSTIPEDFKKIEIERFDPIFLTGESVAKERSADRPKPQLTMVGEGAFAIVYKYDDVDYGFTVAMKAAKKTLTDRELARFRMEFEVLKGLDFPYVVRAYAYDTARDTYTMEYCDFTLLDYIRANNQKIGWSARKRIAQQFLYGINYLHRKGILHRDISRKNVLIQKYDAGAVLVKLSDFGLHKAPDSDFTKVDTEMKGTVVDPTLTSFKEFAVINDIYAVGHVLSFIFSGKDGLGVCTGDEQRIVDRCTDNTVSRRFSDVAEIIAAVERLTDPSAPAADAAATPA